MGAWRSEAAERAVEGSLEDCWVLFAPAETGLASLLSAGRCLSSSPVTSTVDAGFLASFRAELIGAAGLDLEVGAALPPAAMRFGGGGWIPTAGREVIAYAGVDIIETVELSVGCVLGGAARNGERADVSLICGPEAKFQKSKTSVAQLVDGFKGCGGCGCSSQVRLDLPVEFPPNWVLSRPAFIRRYARVRTPPTLQKQFIPLCNGRHHPISIPFARYSRLHPAAGLVRSGVTSPYSPAWDKDVLAANSEHTSPRR